MIANRIMLAGEYRQMEGKCGASLIYPGMLIVGDGAGNKVPHATEGGFAERAFALEDALQGNTTATPYNPVNYANGVSSVGAPADPVQYALAAPGSEVNALLAPGYVYALDTRLISDGAGHLMPAASISSADILYQVIAICLRPIGSTSNTAIDLSASGAVATLNPVRVL